MRLQPDHKIVLAGQFLKLTRTSRGVSGTWGLGMVRLHPDGSLDLSFGQAGLVRVDSHITVNDLLIRANGAILVVGSETTGDADCSPLIGNRLVLVQFAADGSPDDSFGSAGRVSSDQGEWGPPACGDAREARGHHTVVQDDGSIVLAGARSAPRSSGPGNYLDAHVLVRIRTDGLLDTQFGDGGVVTLPVESETWFPTLDRLADGRLLIMGDDGKRPRIVRLDTDGNTDTSYGEEGVVRLPGPAWWLASPEGSILAVQEHSALSVDSSGRVAAQQGGLRIESPGGWQRGPFRQPDGRLIVAIDYQLGRSVTHLLLARTAAVFDFP
jgi:uncharacterized delta-60 repeat protein